MDGEGAKAFAVVLSCSSSLKCSEGNTVATAQAHRYAPAPDVAVAARYSQRVQANMGLLGPQPADLAGRKTLVLDLDETLVHSSFKV